MKKALLLGATGFIGSYLVDELLNNERYSEVVIVVRKPTGIVHAKLKEIIADFNSFEAATKDVFADDVFITLGTTKNNTPDQRLYYQVDHDYPVLAARIFKQKGATGIYMVTAVGANAKSGVFYIRTKGEVERDIIALNYEHTHIFRPSMIMGNRKEHRAAEKIFIRIWSVINPIFVGGLSKYRGIEGKDIARAMNAAASSDRDKVKIYHWKEMNQLL